MNSIRIVKNPNFPSGTSLQAYIKTNRAELRKVFGNPNMGESGDGKSKGKEWNLWVGNHRVTIYDKREKDKKGTKYFNIGGSGKYGALLVAQALSIHRNERVYAKETVPQWLEDERRYQQVKSIDEHPDLTYERAKEYEDNRGRYSAETYDFIHCSNCLFSKTGLNRCEVCNTEFVCRSQHGEDCNCYLFTAETFKVEFNEWADQELMSHGKDISFKDWAQDEGMKHGNTEITEWAQHEDESHNARYGAETFESEEDWYGLKLKERFSMDDWQGWIYEDGDITISIDGSNGVINRESGMSIEEARAYLHRKGIPFDNSTDCSNKSCIHADEYDLVYFNYPNHEKCYKCDWSNVYVRDTQYDDDGEGSVVFGQRCNYGLCNTERRGYVGGEVSWEAESFGAETFEAEGNTQWDKTLAMINQYDMKGIDGASFAYNPTGPRKNELPPFFNKDLVDTHPDFNGDYFNENVVVFIDWCGDKPRNYGTYQGSLHVSPRISKQKVIKQLQDWGIDTTNHKTWKNFGYYDDWGEGKGYTIYNFPLPNTSLCQWSNAYVRDTEYDDDGTAYTTFGQDCIKCNNQRRGSISGDVSWDMNAETGEDYVDYTMWIYTKSAGGLFNGEWEDGESEEQVVKEWKELVREAIEENGDDLITADLRKHSNYDEEGVSQSHEFLFEYEHGEDNLEDFESENWGGNPKGQLATALQKARDKAKKPKKPLKIEKLDAEYFTTEKHSGIARFPKLMKKGDYGLLENYWSRDWREHDSISNSEEDFFELTCVWNEDYTKCSFVPSREWYKEGDNYKTLAADLQLKADDDELRYGWGQFNLQLAKVPGVKEAWANATDKDVSDYDVNNLEIWSEMPDNADWNTDEMKQIEKSFIEGMAKIGFKNAWIYPFAQFLSEFYWGFDIFEPVICTDHKWSNAYVRDTEYDEDGSGSVTFSQDCTICGVQRRGSAYSDVSWDMNAENQNKDLLKWIEDYLWDNDKKGYQAYHAHRKSLGLGAEDKKRSGLLSDPFDELSLDSGDWKGIVAGFGVGLLALFGYSKLRK